MSDNHIAAVANSTNDRSPNLNSRGSSVIRTPQEINILLVGETGIGKSTCINSIATYLKYGNFKKASTSPLINLIPTDFTYEDDDDEGDEITHQTIIIGRDDNESTQIGQSRTLKPKAHVFELEGCLVRIIDTPGISDTEGIIQDKKNMQEIIDFISDLTHLNLIVFLMAPNQSRLTPAFTFCFQELIMQFHRSAADNIVFAFTKSADCGYKMRRSTGKATGYKTGETFIQLKVLLDDIKDKQGIELPLTKKSTTYAFDNKSYRELCIMKVNGKSQLSKFQMKTNGKDYDLSRNELIRLIKHSLHVTPHDPRATAILNYIRFIILRLIGPMTMISTSVQQTLEKVKDRQALIEQYRGNEDELEKILWKRITIVKFRMERKKAISCKTCVTIERYHGDERLPFIAADPELARDDPIILFYGGDIVKGENRRWCCPNCGNKFNRLETTKIYRYLEETVREKDDIVDSQIQDVQEAQESIAEMIAKERKFRDEIIHEREMITKACAKFAVYLITSSILPYNDVTERYLDTLIEVEEKKYNGFQSEYYHSLDRMKKEYLQEKEFLTQRFENTEIDGAITEDDIRLLLKELTGLKHYGMNVREALDCVTVNDDVDIGNNAHNPQPKTQMWRKIIETVGGFFSS